MKYRFFPTQTLYTSRLGFISTTGVITPDYPFADVASGHDFQKQAKALIRALGFSIPRSFKNVKRGCNEMTYEKVNGRKEIRIYHETGQYAFFSKPGEPDVLIFNVNYDGLDKICEIFDQYKIIKEMFSEVNYADYINDLKEYNASFLKQKI